MEEKRKLEEIKRKASYCLQCKKPLCKQGCPLQNNIPDFIEHIKEGNLERAYKELSETTIFEPICGRICPHSEQCEKQCIRGIKGKSVSIGELETYVGDWMLDKQFENGDKNEKKQKVAIIGSGPAGIACAYRLNQQGYQVTLYEKHKELGGLLRYGIPSFRLPRNILDKWIEQIIIKQGIEIKTNTTLGKDISIEKLKEDYDRIVLAFGANLSYRMKIPGEARENVLGANELLEYQDFPDFHHKKVAIVGGGNVAMDAARTIQRQGAKEVTIIYRRSEEEMPAERKEIKAAKEENIQFLFQTNLLKVKNNEIECIKTKLLSKDTEKRKYPVDIEGSNFVLGMDYVIMAIGSHADSKMLETLKLETTDKGYVKVDSNYQTYDKKIYAIGDVIGTKQTVAWAAKSGFDCATSIIENQ